VNMVKLDGNRVLCRVDRASRVERLDPTTVRLHHLASDERYYDITFEDALKAEHFSKEVDRRCGKQLSTASGKLLASPAGCGAPKPLKRHVPADDDFASLSAKNRLPVVGNFMHGVAIHPDVLLKAQEAPSRDDRHDREGGGTSKLAAPPPKTREADDGLRRAQDAVASKSADDEFAEKRRKIDALAPTAIGTPEKMGQHRTSTFVRRAPLERNTNLVLARHTPAPQSSATYRGYRSSETFGLRNLGNTCYLNAVMQALCSLREFIADVRAMPNTMPQCNEGELFRCTVDILKQMSLPRDSNGPLSPAKLREHIAVASPMFGSCEQQDAHEFFLEYVNQLHDELLAARKRWLCLQIDEPPSADMGILATQLHLDSEVQKDLACSQCGQIRHIRERFRDFSLDFDSFGGNDSCTLASMVESYFKPELLEAKCDACSATTARMEKTLVIPPRTLVLHLKRFVPNVERRRYEKRHQQLAFPVRFNFGACLRGAPDAAEMPSVGVLMEKLSATQPPLPRLPARPLASSRSGGGVPDSPQDVSGQQQLGNSNIDKLSSTVPHPQPDLPSSRGVGAGVSPIMEAWYNLRSVVTHNGASPQSGHYVCYGCGENGVWRLYDDSNVRSLGTEFDPQHELGRTAYILFYVLEVPAIPKDCDLHS